MLAWRRAVGRLHGLVGRLVDTMSERTYTLGPYEARVEAARVAAG